MTSNPVIFGINPFDGNSENPQHQVGVKGVSPEGKVFRYVKCGGTGIAVGKLCIAPDVQSNHEDIAFASAGSVGDTKISVTLGATGVDANEYDEGFLCVIDDTGEGYSYPIERHDTSSSGSENINVYIKQPGLRAATTTSTTVTLVSNPYKNVLISDGTQTDLPVGVTVKALTANYYGWVQTGGIASVLTDNNGSTAGTPVTIGDTNSGAVETRNAAGEPYVGIVPAGANGTAGEHNPVYLQIDSV